MKNKHQVMPNEVVAGSKNALQYISQARKQLNAIALKTIVDRKTINGRALAGTTLGKYNTQMAIGSLMDAKNYINDLIEQYEGQK